MIEAALQEKAPKLYRELKKEKKLQTFLKEREALMMESYDQAWEAGMNQPEEKDYLKRIQQITEMERRAWEETMETYLDFSDSETTE